MLAQWINHYSTPFGLSNLPVMDNGPRDRKTIDILKTAESRGMNVMWGYDTPHDFRRKGGHLGNIIKGIRDAIGGYDFALPVDCDELLAVVAPRG
ncbi:glycosyltransferase family 2 protein [Rhizosaccharibacter radicis]|uniref:Glycosyltransferase family 2 protein n=1 Tax=Rhizosaccharibacter radicis TaxID=2782605 RepID=A0ABT1W0N7_9PROT|nr:glycosyltransferase family 2 protein [Acetobacteraceae bacterium KSS12]